MKNDGAKLLWGVQQRLEFIEFRLFWEGQVNRSDLMEQFRVSVNQASTDLNHYLRDAPGNMVYDKRLRTYVPGRGFTPQFLEPDAGRYLAQLRSVDDGILDRDDAWIDDFPAFEAAPTPARGIDPITLRTVVRAIKRSEAIEVYYQSLSRPQPMWRWMAPHAIAFDGFRWHARAWCEIDGSFKDFLLSRIRKVRNSGPAPSAELVDTDWITRIALRIAPHPGLSDDQKAVIEQDYGMAGGSTAIIVRKALLYYSLKRLGLDTDPAARRPQDQQIVLIGQESVDQEVVA